MASYPTDLQPLIIRRPLVIYLGEIFAIFCVGATGALLLQQTEQIWWALMIAIAAIFAIIRSMTYGFGTVELIDDRILIRQGFLRMRETEIFLLHDDITVRLHFFGMLFGWGKVQAVSQYRRIISPTVSHARLLDWAIRERRQWLEHMHIAALLPSQLGAQWLIDEPHEIQHSAKMYR